MNQKKVSVPINNVQKTVFYNNKKVRISFFNFPPTPRIF